MSAGYLDRCVGKRGYATRDEALRVRRAMASQGKWTLASTRSYRCVQCGLYHLGHIGTGRHRKGQAKGRARR